MVVRNSSAQDMPLGREMIIAAPALNAGIDPSAYHAFVTGELSPALGAPGAELHLFRADRGDLTGEHLLVWTLSEETDNAQHLLDRTFTERHREFLSAPGPYTRYALVAPDRLADLPRVEILGIHNVQVKPERREAFEAFVRDTLYQAFAGRTPGMHLLYYRGIGGEYPTNYIALFAIETTAAREQYWPTGAPETEALTAAFRPLRSVAESLTPYLVEDTFLKPETGAAAAIFESLDWNDYVHVRAKRR